MHNCYDNQDPTANIPGTVFKVYIPAGAVINVLNLLEVSSPEGISLVVRLPILAGTTMYNGLINTVQQAGGTINPLETGYYPAYSYTGYRYPPFGTGY